MGAREGLGISADLGSGVTWVIGLGFLEVREQDLDSRDRDKCLDSLRHCHAFVPVSCLHVIEQFSELPVEAPVQVKRIGLR
jgi:hypothetical protein